MRTQNFKEISLSKISSNPQSPRKNFSGPKFDELVDSIRAKGVIEPIIIRPLPEKVKQKGPYIIPYEVVAGDRRLKACELLASEDKGTIQPSIPAIIRPYTDDEAYECMLIENLQREDLTAFEEAWAFKLYCELKGKGSVADIAKKLGKSAGYLRRKIAVLGLPGYALKAWEKGKLTFSHLEQLRRLKNKDDLKEAFDYATGARFGRGDDGLATKRQLKEHIDQAQPLLEKALFDIEKEGCKDCGQNSNIQREQWEIEGMEGVFCLDKRCFKQKQNNFLLANWKQSKYRKRHGTNGFRFREDVNYQDINSFEYRPQKPTKKCKECPKFVTLLHVDGKIETGQVCIGEENCFEAVQRSSRATEVATVREEKKELGGPRVDWHGEHFREAFLEKRLPEVYNEIPHEDIKMARAGLFAFVKSDNEILQALARELKFKKSYSDKSLFERIAIMELGGIQRLTKVCALKVIMKHWPVSCDGRLAVAAHLGVDLKKEFAVTEDYLEHKTIREMLEFGESSGIFKSKKVKDYLENTLKRKKFSSCKKVELIDLFLKSGVNLVGKVPAEILDTK